MTTTPKVNNAPELACRQRATYVEQISPLIRINFLHIAGNENLVEDDGGMQLLAAATSQS